MTGYDGFKRITGTKIHVAVEQNGLPISTVISPANEHDSAKFVDVTESISDFTDNSMTNQIVSVYADRGYGAKYIGNYPRNSNITCYIPYKGNSKFILQNNSYNNYSKTRSVAERFFAQLKNGFHGTRIRYERRSENYLAFVYLASIMMYWRVLG